MSFSEPEAPMAPAAPPNSTTIEELKAITPELAQATLKRLIEGYNDKSGSSYGPAITNNTSCLLAQKAPNRAVSMPYSTQRLLNQLINGIGKWLCANCTACGSGGEKQGQERRTQEDKG